MTWNYEKGLHSIKLKYLKHKKARKCSCCFMHLSRRPLRWPIERVIGSSTCQSLFSPAPSWLPSSDESKSAGAQAGNCIQTTPNKPPVKVSWAFSGNILTLHLAFISKWQRSRIETSGNQWFRFKNSVR